MTSLSNPMRVPIAATLIAALLASTRPANAEELTPAQMVAPAEDAINRGLKYLASEQEDDGSFGAGYGRNAGVVALCGMAFISSGSAPGRGPYGENLNRCVDYLIEHTQPSGFITVDGTTSQGPMYGHGFATLLLAEAYGMAPRDDLRDKLAAAVQLIVGCQNDEGGWRYQPRPDDADISVTICQIMALRAARNAGLHVPAETIDRCVAYVRRCQNPDGGFSYTSRDNSSMFPRSAAGVVALYSAGIYDGDEIERGLAYLNRHRPGMEQRRSGHYFYGQYYATQAMWQAGGERWQEWYPAVRGDLLTRQQMDGSWKNNIGPQYATAMACIILQTPNDLVPIFQR